MFRTLLGLAALGILIESAVRLSGVTDFPIYQTDADIGYIPAPNQSGMFLQKNDWMFNSRSMGTAEFVPDLKTDVLLLGDSIVYGGNPYRQREKFGPQLEEALGSRFAVWPAGAGSWAVSNEETFLHRNRDILPALEVLVWVVNSGDFAEKSRWTSELTHPTSRPRWATGYAARRYLWPRLAPRWMFPEAERNLTAPPHPPAAALVAPFGDALAEIRRSYPKLRMEILWYPNRLECGDPGLSRGLQAEVAAIGRRAGVPCLNVSDVPQWNSACYRDEIHPTPAGFKILAAWLAGKLSELSPDLQPIHP